MGKLDISISEVKQLVELVEKHHLNELTVQEDDLSITIKGQSAPSAAPVIVQSTAALPPADMATAQEEYIVEEEPDVDKNVVDIISPVVGVFYRSPSHDAPPFVEVGDIIEVGAEVGLIEAMKVFSPIPSEFAGEVVAILAENGKLVQQGDVLVRIRLAES